MTTVLTPKQWHQIAGEYIAGDSVTDLAAKYHVGRSTVSARLRRMGVEVRPPVAVTPLAAHSLEDDGLKWVQRGNILVGVPITDADYQPAIDYACTFCGASDTEGCMSPNGDLTTAHKDRRRPRRCACGNPSRNSTSARCDQCASEVAA